MVLISLRLWDCSFLQLSEITSVSLPFPSIHMEPTDSPIKADNVLTMLHSSPSVFTVIDFMNLTPFGSHESIRSPALVQSLRLSPLAEDVQSFCQDHSEMMSDTNSL